jgi:hypothetical protein
MEVKRLIDILADGYILEDKEMIVKNCEEAFQNPIEYTTKNELQWLLETNQDSILNVLLPLELSEIIVRGDKVDEIHEQLTELIENLPDFPYQEKLTTKLYFEWIEKYLGDNNELLLIGDSLGDELLIFLVYKDDSDEIFYLADKLNIQCSKPTEYFY